MARTNNLTNFLTDVASAIKTKTGDSTAIPASQFDTKIADITTGHLDNTEYTEANNDLDDILENAQLPSGTINITTNGIVDVTDYSTANVNVQSSTFILPDGVKFSRTNTFPVGLITTNITNMYYFLAEATITELPLIDTSNAINMERAFYYCQYLQDFPVLNTSKVTNLRNAFSYCSALNNNALNNILEMLINATTYNDTKTLKWIGLTSAQATTCTTLSNWAAAEAAGWTTGY